MLNTKLPQKLLQRKGPAKSKKRTNGRCVPLNLDDSNALKPNPDMFPFKNWIG